MFVVAQLQELRKVITQVSMLLLLLLAHRCR
jgi:hypothetical protein